MLLPMTVARKLILRPTHLLPSSLQQVGQVEFTGAEPVSFGCFWIILWPVRVEKIMINDK